MPNFPEDVSAEVLLHMLLTVLQVHYARKSQAVQDILQGFDELDSPTLLENWRQLKLKAPNDTEALRLFAEWVDASLDGGNLTRPETH